MNNRRRTWYKKSNQFTPFISTWRTTNTSTGSSASNQVKLPLISTGTYNFIVNWGDGNEDTITAWNQAQVTHTYTVSGDYIITITGVCNGWSFAGLGDRLKILTISSWGSIVFPSNGNINTGVFFNCTNLNITATDVLTLPALSVSFFRNCTSLIGNTSFNNWVLSTATNLTYFFTGCSNFNQSVNSWDVSNVTSFQGIFALCTTFNQPLNSWNVSSGTNFSEMFSGATIFNQNIGSWNVSAATNMAQMFRLSAFNNGGSSTIDNWNVGNVTTFGGNNAGMFANCPFNQPIGSWNMSKATTLQDMFRSNTIFNQNIGAWNVGFVTILANTFNGASAFNNGGSPAIDNWNVGNVTSFFSTFANCPFNQPIGSWDMSKATSVAAMFLGNTFFNQNIGSWNLSLVTSFGGNGAGMFQGATAFNQNISSWNVLAATTMRAMFLSANNFNQDISSWNVSNVTDFIDLMRNKTNLNYSAANLDAIYNQWTNRSLSVSEEIHFGTIKYTAAAIAARALLSRANATVTVTNAVNNGSGLIRIITGAAHGRTTGDKIFINGVAGTTEANGGWIVTVIDGTTVDLDGSTFTNTYVSGGTFRTGYGWTIIDGGL